MGTWCPGFDSLRAHCARKRQRKAKHEHGIKVLAAACLALNQVGEGSSPSDPTE